MFHPVYREAVLLPDYQHARVQLLPYFLEALSAHALDLHGSGTAHAAEALGALLDLREFVPAPPDPASPEMLPDLFFLLDREVAARSQAGAGALRTALSRNDLDMTVYRLAARGRLQAAMRAVLELRGQLLRLARQEAGTIMVAFTHHQPAQPTTLGHYLSGAADLLARDTARLHGAYLRLNRCPLGAVALAGSSHPLEREHAATLLGFSGLVVNTYDAVAAGDWQAEIAGALSVCAVSCSRVVRDLLGWAEGGLVTLQDGLVQGSSVMPQKRNPVTLEHARTRFSRVLGAAQAVLLCGHNVPYGDLNDVSTDAQEPLEVLWNTFAAGSALLLASLQGLLVQRERLLAQAWESESTLTELADELARLSGDFRWAHHLARQLLEAVKAAGRPLHLATDEDLRRLAPDLAFPEGLVRRALSPEVFVARRTTVGGPAPQPLDAQLTDAGAQLEADTAAEDGWARAISQAREQLWTEAQAAAAQTER